MTAFTSELEDRLELLNNFNNENLESVVAAATDFAEALEVAIDQQFAGNEALAERIKARFIQDFGNMMFTLSTDFQ